MSCLKKCEHKDKKRNKTRKKQSEIFSWVLNQFCNKEENYTLARWMFAVLQVRAFVISLHNELLNSDITLISSKHKQSFISVALRTNILSAHKQSYSSVYYEHSKSHGKLPWFVFDQPLLQHLSEVSFKLWIWQGLVRYTYPLSW
jgi:hypothetical protein